MVRISNGAKLLAVVLALVGAGPAFAETAAKEITGFYKLKVEFTKNATKCGFQSLEPFERNLRKDLDAIGVRQTEGSIIEILLEVGAINYGALETQCAIIAAHTERCVRHATRTHLQHHRTPDGMSTEHV
jgi:hypothetical protein